MDEEFYNPIPKRLKRRMAYEKIQKAAWKKTDERIREMKLWENRNIKYIPHKRDEIYAAMMVSDGHWLKGGCSKRHCMLCGFADNELSKRDLIQQEKFQQELKDYLEE